MKPREIQDLPLSDPRRFLYELDRLIYMIEEFGDQHNYLGALWSDIYRHQDRGLHDLATTATAEAVVALRKMLRATIKAEPEAAIDVYGSVPEVS